MIILMAASIAAVSWLEGEPLDIENLIGHKGKTPCAIIYMAHLGEQERQFVAAFFRQVDGCILGAEARLATPRRA